MVLAKNETSSIKHFSLEKEIKNLRDEIIGAILAIPLTLFLSFKKPDMTNLSTLIYLSLIFFVSFILAVIFRRWVDLERPLKILNIAFAVITVICIWLIYTLILYRGEIKKIRAESDNQSIQLAAQVIEISTSDANSSAFQATIDFQSTQLATLATPFTPIPSNNLLFGDCLSPNMWTAYRSGYMNKIDNCLKIPGLSLDNGKLEFFVYKDAKYGTYGIYTPIEGNKNIKISMNIDEFSIPFGGLYSRIMFGIVPYSNPVPENGIMFMLQLETNSQKNPLLKYRSPNKLNTVSLNEYISTGNLHSFNLNVKEQYVTLFVDNVEKNGNFILPNEPTYFWIGFTVENGGILNSTIHELEITE